MEETQKVSLKAHNIEDCMGEIQSAHETLKEGYGELDGMVDQVVGRNELLLNSRFVSRVNQEVQKLKKLKEKLVQVNWEIENNEEVYKLNNQMKSYSDQNETLSRLIGQLKAQLCFYKEKYRREESEVENLRTKLTQLSKENLETSSQIEDLTKDQKELTFLESPKKQTTFDSKMPSINYNQLDEEQHVEISELVGKCQSLKRQIADSKEESKHLSSLQGEFLGEQRKLEEFFQECLRSAKQELLKSQQLPQISHRGLAGSLFFDIVQSENINKRISPQGFIRERPQRSKIMERDSSNVIYYTIKTMMKHARDETRMQHLNRLNLSWEEFRQFNTLQLLGLLSIRSDTQALLHQKIFPANLMHLVIHHPREYHSTRNSPNKKLNTPSQLRVTRSRVGRELINKHKANL